MIQIPLPGMAGDEALMIASQPVKHPVCRRDMRIIEGAVNGLRLLLVPTRPTAPIQIVPVVTPQDRTGLIVEQALPDTVRQPTMLILDAAPQNAIDELLILVELFLIGLPKLFHDRREPRSRTALIAQAGDPNAAVLRDDPVVLPVVGHHRRTAMERVTGVDKPLLRHQKMTQVGNH